MGEGRNVREIFLGSGGAAVVTACIDAMRRFGILAILYVATLVCGLGVAHWRILPADTSGLPLYVVALSSCCVVGYWLANHSQYSRWRLLVPIAVVGLTASLRWVGDGMHGGLDLVVYSTYVRGELAVLAGVTCGSLLIIAKSERQNTNQSSVQFSVADLILVTTLCAVSIAAAMYFSPRIGHYEYLNDVTHSGGISQCLVVSTLLIVTPVLVAFRISQARIVRTMLLAAVVFCTLVASTLTAKLAGVSGNPLWACYALVPSSTVCLVALSVIMHRQCAGINFQKVQISTSDK